MKRNIRLLGALALLALPVARAADEALLSLADQVPNTWVKRSPPPGGPQLSETWTFDPATSKWELLRTNNTPPGTRTRYGAHQAHPRGARRILFR